MWLYSSLYSSAWIRKKRTTKLRNSLKQTHIPHMQPHIQTHIPHTYTSHAAWDHTSPYSAHLFSQMRGTQSVTSTFPMVSSEEGGVFFLFSEFEICGSWAWWSMFVLLEVRRLKQEYEVILDYIAGFFQKRWKARRKGTGRGGGRRGRGRGEGNKPKTGKDSL